MNHSDPWTDDDPWLKALRSSQRECESTSKVSKSFKRRLRRRRLKVSQPPDLPVEKFHAQQVDLFHQRLFNLETMMADIHYVILGQFHQVAQASQGTVSTEMPGTPADVLAAQCNAAHTIQRAWRTEKVQMDSKMKHAKAMPAKKSEDVGQRPAQSGAERSGLRRCKALELRCTRPNGELDPCMALELIMGKSAVPAVKGDFKPPKTSTSLAPDQPHQQHAVKSATEPDNSVAEQFMQCWQALGTCNDADKILQMLQSVQQWRRGDPGRLDKVSRPCQWWKLLLNGFHDDLACDRAIETALKF